MFIYICLKEMFPMVDENDEYLFILKNNNLSLLHYCK